MKRNPPPIAFTSPFERARTWLQQYLRQPGRHYAVPLHQAAQQAGHAVHTIRRARKTLPIRVRRERGTPHGHWYWALDEPEEPFQKKSTGVPPTLWQMLLQEEPQLQTLVQEIAGRADDAQRGCATTAVTQLHAVIDTCKVLRKALRKALNH